MCVANHLFADVPAVLKLCLNLVKKKSVELKLSVGGGVGAVVVVGGWGEAWFGLIFDSQRSHT